MTSRDRFRRSAPFRGVTWVALGLVAALLAVAPVLDSGQYQAFTGAIQALGLVVALGLAWATLESDSRDRRVDRVLSLHGELTTGEVQAARTALTRLLRDRGTSPLVLRPTLDELGAISDEARRNGALVLRYFERVDAARRAGSLHDDLSYELLGRHAMWLRLALCRADTGSLHEALMSFADWAHHYEGRATGTSLRIGSGRTTRSDFGASYAEVVAADVRAARQATQRGQAPG